jgi:hypothetical protein
MTRTPVRVAVVGGGAFGTKAAVDLGRRGHHVELFERHPDLLQAASGINQYRLHRGYHYPRSLTTAIDCRDSELMFHAAFPEAVVDSAEHYYAIAASGSLTSRDAYLRFCDRAKLEYQVTDLDLLVPGSASLVVRVRESLFDPAILRRLLGEELSAAGVRVHLGVEATPRHLDRFDLVVLATYAELNVLGGAAGGGRTYQFEVCEKPVVRLPARYAQRSVVMMDGPFMCVDPLPGTDLYVLGNVVHAIHHTNVGTHPQIPDAIRPLLDRGIVPSPPVTRIGEFVSSGRTFFREFERLEHVGSMFTVRTVLPWVDATDARPTVVRRASDRIITVFSGKIDTCVSAAQQITDMVDAMAFEREADGGGVAEGRQSAS